MSAGARPYQQEESIPKVNHNSDSALRQILSIREYLGN